LVDGNALQCQGVTRHEGEKGHQVGLVAALLWRPGARVGRGRRRWGNLVVGEVMGSAVYGSLHPVHMKVGSTYITAHHPPTSCSCMRMSPNIRSQVPTHLMQLHPDVEGATARPAHKAAHAYVTVHRDAAPHMNCIHASGHQQRRPRRRIPIVTAGRSSGQERVLS
jgi:hypothetical protein